MWHNVGRLKKLYRMYATFDGEFSITVGSMVLGDPRSTALV